MGVGSAWLGGRAASQLALFCSSRLPRDNRGETFKQDGREDARAEEERTGDRATLITCGFYAFDTSQAFHAFETQAWRRFRNGQ